MKQMKRQRETKEMKARRKQYESVEDDKVPEDIVIAEEVIERTLRPQTAGDADDEYDEDDEYEHEEQEVMVEVDLRI